MRITEHTTLGEIVDEHPEVLEVLEDFGIRIDPWTLIALRSSLLQLAEYSAIRNPDELRRAIQQFLESETAAHRPG
jgi:hypothetical protein